MLPNKYDISSTKSSLFMFLDKIGKSKIKILCNEFFITFSQTTPFSQSHLIYHRYSSLLWGCRSKKHGSSSYLYLEVEICLISHRRWVLVPEFIQQIYLCIPTFIIISYLHTFQNSFDFLHLVTSIHDNDTSQHFIFIFQSLHPLL